MQDRKVIQMNLLQALIAGVVQGFTEFLPVSSSGHLVLFGALFGFEGSVDLGFTIFLHFATLLSVVLVFHKDVWLLIREFFSALGDIIRGKPDFRTPERRFLLMVLIGTIPAVIAGAAVKLLKFDDILENIFVVAAMLSVTAVFMFCVDRVGKRRYTKANAPFSSAIITGLFQSVAILPGLSRSGSAIFGGILGGLKKEFAVRYTFILSIPVILGAGIMEFPGAVKTGGLLTTDLPNRVAGFFIAAVCGIIAINFVKLLMRGKKFYIFGIYCLLASAVAFLTAFGFIGRI